MRIALRHRPGFVTEQPLDPVQIDSPLHESRGERVPHIVEAEIWNTGPIPRFTKLPNQEPHLKGIAQRRLEDPSA
jgi:hypothetical protein